MGAILGVVFKGRWSGALVDRARGQFDERYSKGIHWDNEQAYFGVAHTDVTTQSVFETGPLVDKDVLIVADAVILNRKAVMDCLGLDQPAQGALSDSQLIMKAYLKWGEKCVDYLVGSFSFVVYNLENKQVFAVRDHQGSSKFYYVNHQNFFAFSTSMSCLLALLKDKPVLNDLWIANFLTLNDPVHEFGDEQTVFQDIYQLNPSHCLTLSNDCIEKKKYWVVDIHKQQKISYEDAVLGLRDILNSVTDEMTTTTGNVGVLLSGGLDSASISCFAAEKLNAQDKNLYGYTSIPLETYSINPRSYYIEDETAYIEPLIQKYANIKPRFIRSEKKSSLTDIDEHLDFFEHPYKIVENFYWLNEIFEEAHKDGCTVMLSGGFGNYTISSGLLPEHFMTLVNKNCYGEAIKSVQEFAMFMGGGRKKTYKYFTQLFLSQFNIKKPVFSFENLLINKNFAQLMRIDEIHKDRKIGQFIKQTINTYDAREFSLYSGNMAQVNSIDSGAYRKYHIQMNDPSMDKRVVEYCYSLPPEYYVRNGRERQLIRDALSNHLPDKIRLNYNRRGVQSADWMYRIKEQIADLRTDMLFLLKGDLAQKYFDQTEIINCLDRLANDYSSVNSMQFRMLLIGYVLLKFLNQYE